MTGRRTKTDKTVRRMLAGMLAALLLLPAVCGAQEQNAAASNKKEVRACIIGGLALVNLLDDLNGMFEEKTGYKLVVVSTGPRTRISKPFRRGKADLLTMHSGDITTNLVADGYGINMRPWARNDLVILGPPDDPAGIRGMKSGAAALRKIARTGSPFIDNPGNGPRELGHTLWKKSGMLPRGPWFLQDESDSHFQKVKYAESKNAYIIYGRMPITYSKIYFGKMEIMVGDDPAMRRPYVVMEANPAVFPHANYTGARAFSDFLLSEDVQKYMLTFGLEKNGGKPPFYPVWPVGERVNQ